MSTPRDPITHELGGLDHLKAVAEDEQWVDGDLDVSEVRPTHNLETDPAQRKWMMLGFAACGLATIVAVVFLLARDGGEAQAARDAFEALSASEQADLVAFLDTL